MNQNTDAPIQMTDAKMHMSMGFHKFLIYFALWGNAVVKLFLCIGSFIGDQWGESKYLIYSLNPGIKTLDLLFSMCWLVSAVFVIVTRYNLANFKPSGITFLKIAFVLSPILWTVYYFVLSIIIDIDFFDLLFSSGATGFGSNLFWLIVTHFYYKKRRYLFIS